jgi:hypothetical protein
MSIKQNADSAHFAARPDEHSLAVALDEAFDVTFGKVHGDLAFWFAEPKQNARERFGLNQEVLVVYSPHPRTDARTLTAIENITRIPEFRHRVEKVLILLIHRGERKATVELVRGQTDWVVVAIHAEDLLSPARGNVFLRSHIATAVGDIDLFGMSSPIRSDKYLFGRDELINNVVQRSVVRRENSGLFGLRKTGKTSILFAVQRRVAERPVLCEYIDCQNPGVHAARWWQVLESVAQRLSVSLQRIHRRAAKIDGGYSSTTAGARFTADMKAIAAAGSLDQILLMLDEVEYITPTLSGALGKHWDADFLPFWQSIRATHQEMQGQLSFIVAGVNPACVELSHFSAVPNPIFQLAVPQYIESLSVTSVREMVRSIGRYSGLRFEEDVYTYLHQRYGGHPFLIRLACSEVWRNSGVASPERLTKVVTSDFASVSDQIRSRLAQPIRDILLSLVWWYPEEYELLQLLAAGHADFVADFVKEKPTSALQFARYGLLTGDSYEFAIVDLRQFLIEHGEAYRKEISPFTRGDMPPELLPAVPDLELLGRLFERRTEIEVKMRRAIALYLGIKNNWRADGIARDIIKGLKRRADRQKPEDLFVGRSPQEVLNELFTLDLKTIVLENWDVFGPLVDNQKTRFEMNMDTLNTARRVDAHAKPVSPREAEEFSNSYTWLLNRLARVPNL